VLKVLPEAFMVKRVVDDEFKILKVPSVDMKENDWRASAINVESPDDEMPC
jgi:hypothetical protein